MNILKLLYFSFLLGVLMENKVDARSQSEPERNGFFAEEPLKYIKLAFSVKENEKAFVDTIKDASTSIASFAQEVAELDTHISPDVLKHVLPQARSQLRLPPEASNGKSRYIYSLFYCWKLLSPEKIQVQIEWADITTPQHYTDSYVFVKAGVQWYFSQHGNVAPFKYNLVGYEFKRPCSN